MPHMMQQRPQNKKGQTYVELQMGEKIEDPGDKRALGMLSLDRQSQIQTS